MGRKEVWVGRRYGSEGGMGRKEVWVGRRYGSEGGMGRKEVWGPYVDNNLSSWYKTSVERAHTQYLKGF